MSNNNNIFKQKITYKSLGGYIVTYIISPTKISDATPILFMPGWGASPETAYVFGQSLAKSTHQSVWILDHESLDSCKDIPEKEYADVPCLEYTKAVGIYTIVTENTSIPQFDIVTHSEGSVAGVIAVCKSPDRYRTIILSNPAGLLSSDSLGGLSYRFVHAVYSHIHNTYGVAHARSVRLWEQVLRYVLTNPIKTFREAFSLPYSDIRPFIENIVIVSPNKLTILLSENDIIFPTQSILKTLRNKEGMEVIKVPGNHIQMFITTDHFSSIIAKQIKKYENN